MADATGDAQLERLFRLSPDLLCIAGSDGYFRRVNPAFEQVLGYSADELMSRSFLEFVHPDDREETLAVLEQLRAGQPLVDFRNRYRAADGSFRWLQWRSSAADEEDLIYAVARDVTEQRRTQRLVERQRAELARSNEDLEQFAYAVSHDLQAPLRSVENLVDFLEEDLDSPPETVSGHLRELRRLSRQAQGLVGDLLTYSRAGRRPGEIREVRLPALVEEIGHLVNPPEGFTIEVAADPEALRTAPAPLEQVLRNLIANALKHHDREHGRVVVGMRSAGAFWEFTVVDDGPGIPEEHRARALRMFERLDTEATGSGLGLALVRKIVERLGGRIVIEAAPERGTTVRFSWPKTIPGTETE